MSSENGFRPIATLLALSEVEDAEHQDHDYWSTLYDTQVDIETQCSLQEADLDVGQSTEPISSSAIGITDLVSSDIFTKWLQLPLVTLLGLYEVEPSADQTLGAVTCPEFYGECTMMFREGSQSHDEDQVFTAWAQLENQTILLLLEAQAGIDIQENTSPSNISVEITETPATFTSQECIAVVSGQSDTSELFIVIQERNKLLEEVMELREHKK